MNHSEWLERAELYALGALDGEELAEFEAHVASGCPACERHLRETHESLTLLPRSLSPLTPPAAVKATLIEQVAREEVRGPRERMRPAWRWWPIGVGAVATAGLLIALSWTVWSTRQQLQRLEGEMAALREGVKQREEVVRFLTDPQVRLIQLAGLGPSPGATGRLLWNPVTRTGLFLTRGLPQVQPDRAYELWAIAGDEAVPAGVFTVDQRGEGVLELPPLPEAKTFDKFAVTLEPAGGVPKATGPMVLLGSL